MILEYIIMYRNFDYFCIEDGLVFREVIINYEKRKKNNLFLLLKYMRVVLVEFYNDIGNLV